MKALTISQPWASMIADGVKFAENRTWRTSYRGPVLIHAGRGKQYLTPHEAAELGLPQSEIIAVADLAACVHVDQLRADVVRGRRSQGLTVEQTIALAYHAHTEGPFAFVLENVRKLDRGIPCRGNLALWNPPEHVVAEIVDQVGPIDETPSAGPSLF